MDTNKIKDILNYYENTYNMCNSKEEILKELLDNNVEVHGNSYYCEVYDSKINATVILAGTKDKADMWVMKKIIRTIKNNDYVLSALNGNIEYLVSKLSRYNCNVISEVNGVAIISFKKDR
jgi:hypothetical protein